MYRPDQVLWLQCEPDKQKFNQIQRQVGNERHQQIGSPQEQTTADTASHDAREQNVLKAASPIQQAKEYVDKDQRRDSIKALA